MQPTTVTTIVLILFAIGLLTLAGYAYLGSWEPRVRRAVAVQPVSEAEIEVALAQMRQAIDDYERRQGL